MKRPEQINPHRVKKQLINDQLAYVQSIGKQDIEPLSEAVNQVSGRGTVVRCFLGATTLMPLRSLSYVAATARVAEIVPCEQIQFVNVLHVNESVNSVDLSSSTRQAELLSHVGGMLLRLFGSDIASKAVFAQDSSSDMAVVKELRPLIDVSLKGNEKLQNELDAMGAKHGGDSVLYGAAHVAYQDINSFAPVLLNPGSTAIAAADRVVTVGGLKERTFYNLRMVVRDELDVNTLLPSAQIFTNHAVPPYYVARGGEQSLEHALKDGVDMNLATDIAARRDMQYLFNTIETLGDRK
ncbi:MAG: hypothetical protein ABI354_02270 [Candidatus Saccharimonadales bacterium]